MVVSDTHRFLFGETPASVERRVWLLHGQTQDYFFHNLFHGCLDLRHTLERWALESGMDLAVTVDRAGQLDFSGNPDPAAAQALFEGARSRRPLRYGSRHTPSSRPGERSEGERRAKLGDAAAWPADPAQPDEAAQAASRVRSAAGSAAQTIENALGKVSQVLRNREVAALVLVEDFPTLLRSLAYGQQTAPLCDRILSMAQTDWHGRAAHSSLLVFFAHTPQGLDFLLREVFPGETFRAVTVKNLKGPEPPEIAAALDRVAARHGIVQTAPEPVSKVLARLGNLRMALGTVQRALQGRRELTLDAVLQLPPINPGRAADIQHELQRMVGLAEVKSRLEALRQRATAFRQRLADGAAELPEETFHLVFTGNPGTGKTTVARIVARFFHALGFLRRDTVKELTASTVMSSNEGGTRERMEREIDDAVGGVLFIDEAHQLGVADSTQGREAVEALVPAAWNHRHQLVIILAGYEERMHELFNMDSGLDRRFPAHNRVRFSDYSPNELWTILARRIERRGYTLDPRAEGPLRAVLGHRSRRRAFGNAGGVENLVDEVVQRHTAGPDGTGSVLTADDVPALIRRDPAAFQAGMSRLEALVGLGPVRQRIARLVDTIQYDLEEAAEGQGEVTRCHPGNMLFLGPPGTGKTTVAHLMSDLLFGLGAIERRTHVAASREQLIGRYQGESTFNLMAALDRARDGVFLVDEAYGLALDEHDTYGNELVNALVGQITNAENAGTVFILAGYEAEMSRFLQRNAGLGRRFGLALHFPSFTPDACAELAVRLLTGRGHTWEPALRERVAALAAEEAERTGPRFGNAGWVESLVGTALETMKSRVLRDQIPPGSPLRRLVVAEDLPRPRHVMAPAAGAAPDPVARGAAWTPRLQVLPAPDTALAAATPQLLGALTSASACQLVVTLADGRSAGGTGFFVTADGILATSAHVVEGATAVRAHCGPEQRAVPARVLAASADLDLALLGVEGGAGAPALPLGDSFGVPPLSELVVFGNAHVSPGESGRLVIARVARNEAGDARHIETDGAIEPGFSGGPALHGAGGGVVGVVRGGHGPSATLLVRAEQLRVMLEELGYRRG